MSHNYNDIPVGVLTVQKLSRSCCPQLRWKKETIFKASTFVLTYLAYTCYHMSRKPISVVKSVLHTNCSESVVHNTSSNDCGYAPFDDANAPALFAALDSAFLFSYAAAMFVSGFVAERVSLRYFLAFGMIFSGVFSYLFGMAKTWNLHAMSFFIFVQVCAGITQTTGWPGVVALIGRWFGKSKRGLVFGIWNSHTSIGNILGTLIAAQYVEKDWALSFIMPGIIIASVGFILFLFLVDCPEMVGCYPEATGITDRSPPNDSDIEEENTNYDAVSVMKGLLPHNSNIYFSFSFQEINYRPSERTPILDNRSATHNAHAERPIGLKDALRIPGVIEFSLCLFFSKLVSYTFLYWLPLYIQSSSTLGPELSADLSILFDVGGIFGAIVAGMISDMSGMSATTCMVMLFLASPVLLVYQAYGATSVFVSVFLLIVAGFLVNGPYALITTSVSAELGQHSSLEGNAKALATVTAIIDGTGSIGAAVGPLMAGMISSGGWQNVFYMLIVSDFIAMLLLVRLVKKECTRVTRSRIRIE
ncbi:LOW QUALITY PROTEIN: glucose-6-phosphate exchanger SLC37A2 [Musca vetustissima]|uniref:LOW QUALITY PROTEIN: glucose-6-phosphate exchanger SLC37A2 n=1 Tax=Musca vetustissima TaxID=27455 RepID=UPI002AB6FC21|nr:LOW QUALITY PROTEIN: glucose-6-phosphate exchanger SLC37A2 [Musca vetustissima]